MSCQQVPRLSEDPYTFTEPPVTATFFNTQIQKLTPIKPLNKIQIPQIKQLHSRVNGCGATVNGISNHHTPIYAKQQQQPQQNYQQSSIQQQQQKITKRLLPPPPSLTATTCSSNPPPLYQQPRTFLIEQKSQTNSNHSIVTSSPIFLQQQKHTITQRTPPKQSHLVVDNSNLDVGFANLPVKIKCEKPGQADNSNGSSNSAKKSNNSKTFVRPKAETKAFSTGKKSTGKSQFAARTKRSYSQSSHHEALQRISSSLSIDRSFIRNTSEWHAPDSYIFDYAGPSAPRPEHIELSPCTQKSWFNKDATFLAREQKLEIKRNHLRRQAFQYAQAQIFRNTDIAKRRLVAVCRSLQKQKFDREASPSRKCGIPSCSNDALALTAYCYLHITLNTDQKLFHPCTAKFSDNSQCRVPVFDISHELPLCREHAWKRDNYNRMLQEQKPKKPPRKKPKPSAMTRPPKRNKKKKKSPTKQHIISTGDIYNHGTVVKSDLVQISTVPQINHAKNGIFSSSQEMFTLCENSSAYESSEDTGVGGLSESELIGAPDEIPLGDARLLEEHDLTNVLNQLPEDAFNELFTVQQNDPYEPTQEEQEDLERALEAVDEQVKSLEQMTCSTSFLGDFLDVDDEILDDSNMCTEVLHSPDRTDIRGLVHT